MADVLVRERLVACVNMWPVRSIYWWEKKIEKASEWVLLCKTRQALAKEVEERIRKLHSYELTVIEQWEVKRVYKGVLKWVNEVTK